jgi:hypothetical protein
MSIWNNMGMKKNFRQKGRLKLGLKVFIFSILALLIFNFYFDKFVDAAIIEEN